MSHPRIRPAAAIGFGLVHVAALGILVLDFTWWGVALCVASYYLRMFAITAGFHRYFSHRTYQLGRVSQFLMAFLGQTAAQKGVLWWAAHHRHHHRYSDMPEDIHSPRQRGFWWSHMGWILAEDYEKADYARIPDFAKYPELRWLDSNQFLATMVYALFMFFAFGWTGLFYGYFLSTVLLWHGTFTINSVMHVFGRRVYATKDDSRNSMIFALVTMGEGWHNNHHHYPGSAAQGFHWWQIDPSYYLLWLGEKVGLVKGLRRVPEKIKAAGLRAFDEALDAASKNMHDRLDQLTARWEELRANARASAHHAIEDLEAKRVRASERLEALQADYAAAKSRAGAAADEKVAKLRKDIEEARAQLAELLARLIEAAEAALSVPSGLPA